VGIHNTATHAVDFGPGGTSSIGPLTAKNMDEWGIRVVIVAGDTVKGEVELWKTT
jgi:fatty acid synthase subunit alpha, fungi type